VVGVKDQLAEMANLVLQEVVGLLVLLAELELQALMDGPVPQVQLVAAELLGLQVKMVVQVPQDCWVSQVLMVLLVPPVGREQLEAMEILAGLEPLGVRDNLVQLGSLEQRVLWDKQVLQVLLVLQDLREIWVLPVLQDKAVPLEQLAQLGLLVQVVERE